MFIGSIRAQDGRWQIELQISLLCCYSCFRLVVVVVVFLCCCCSFVVVFVVRVDVSATVIVVLIVLSFGRRRRCCSCACRCPLSVRIVVVVLVVATLLKTKNSVRVYWFLSSWRLQVFLSAFKVFDSDGNPCLVVALTTGFTGSVCVELLFLRILSCSCNTIFQRLAAENCRGPVLSLGVTGQRRHPQGGVKTYLLAGSLFRDASQRS